MSHTNSTTNYALPQFLTSDKPAWLTDVNNAFSDIDTAIYAAKSKADTAFTDAGNAQTDATTAINNAAAADAKGSGALASIEAAFDPTAIYAVGARVIYNSLLYRCTVAVTTPGAWTGSDNWERITVDSLISTTDSKIGSLSSLSTTDKTSAVNAINEVNGAIPKIKKYYFIGTTSANKNLVLTSSVVSNFDPSKEIIVAVSGRFANASGMVVCTPFADADANLGMTTGLKVYPATEGVNTANVLVDGYFWTIPRT